MYGKMSNKIDVYAFGIVLLELLSGRRAISAETSKEQQSLVMWVRLLSKVLPTIEIVFHTLCIQR